MPGVASRKSSSEGESGEQHLFPQARQIVTQQQSTPLRSGPTSAVVVSAAVSAQRPYRHCICTNTIQLSGSAD